MHDADASPANQSSHVVFVAVEESHAVM